MKQNNEVRVYSDFGSSILRDDDGDPIIWKGDLHPDILLMCLEKKCRNKTKSEDEMYCDEHKGYCQNDEPFLSIQFLNADLTGWSKK